MEAQEVRRNLSMEPPSGAQNIQWTQKLPQEVLGRSCKQSIRHSGILRDDGLQISIFFSFYSESALTLIVALQGPFSAQKDDGLLGLILK